MIGLGSDKYSHWEFYLLADLHTVRIFDEDVQQGNVLLHVLEDLLLERVHSGLVPTKFQQGIGVKEFNANVSSDHVHHIKAEVRVTFLQNFLSCRFLASSIQLPEVEGFCAKNKKQKDPT